MLRIGAMIVTACLAVSATSPVRAQEAPKFEFELKKRDDKVETTVDKDTVFVNLTSKSGIGSLMGTAKDGRWPKQVVIRFASSNGMLEMISASNGAVTLGGALQRGKNPTVLYFDKAGTKIDDKDKAIHTMTIEHVEKEKRIDVKLPAEFLDKKNPTLRLEWIDAYR